jgi:NADPH2:quinone reductase
MRAVVIDEFGPLESHSIKDIEPPKAGVGEVLIKVHAIGINFPDTLMIQGLYQTKPERPFTPGRDVAGVVVEVGANVSGVEPGDRVVTVIPWGGYAEMAVAPESRCFILPDHINFETAAGMITTYLTAWVALMERGAYQKGEKVLVLGASGGVGLAAIQIVKAKGGTAIGGSLSEASRKIVLENGADAAIDLGRDDPKESLRSQVFEVVGKEGVDICLDPIGGRFFDAALRALAFSGRIVVIGFVDGIPTARPNYFNVKNLTMAGMALDLHFRFKPNVIRAAVNDLFDMCRYGDIEPRIASRFSLENWLEAVSQIGTGKSAGKAVMTTGEK